MSDDDKSENPWLLLTLSNREVCSSSLLTIHVFNGHSDFCDVISTNNNMEVLKHS